MNNKGIRLDSTGGTMEGDGAANRKRGAGEPKDEEKTRECGFPGGLRERESEKRGCRATECIS